MLKGKVHAKEQPNYLLSSLSDMDWSVTGSVNSCRTGPFSSSWLVVQQACRGFYWTINFRQWSLLGGSVG